MKDKRQLKRQKNTLIDALSPDDVVLIELSKLPCYVKLSSKFTPKFLISIFKANKNSIVLLELLAEKLPYLEKLMSLALIEKLLSGYYAEQKLNYFIKAQLVIGQDIEEFIEKLSKFATKHKGNLDAFKEANKPVEAKEKVISDKSEILIGSKPVDDLSHDKYYYHYNKLNNPNSTNYLFKGNAEKKQNQLLNVEFSVENFFDTEYFTDQDESSDFSLEVEKQLASQTTSLVALNSIEKNELIATKAENEKLKAEIIKLKREASSTFFQSLELKTAKWQNELLLGRNKILEAEKKYLTEQNDLLNRGSLDERMFAQEKHVENWSASFYQRSSARSEGSSSSFPIILNDDNKNSVTISANNLGLK